MSHTPAVSYQQSEMHSHLVLVNASGRQGGDVPLSSPLLLLQSTSSFSSPRHKTSVPISSARALKCDMRWELCANQWGEDVTADLSLDGALALVHKLLH